ncbi:MAG: substrate-binding domain-containing protein [Gammaproteobacteria bacterium]|nr:substrate-binding domain-containing protein [Gammaproteobacteria bacterium]
MSSKIFLYLILLALLPVSFAASATTQASFTLGFPEDNMSNDWRAAQMKEILEELKKHPQIEFFMADAGGSIAKNILDMEDMASKGVNVMFLGPKNPKAVEPVISRLREQGVRIILLTRKIESDNYDVYISPDDFDIASRAAHYLGERLKGKGRILMLEGVRTTTTAANRKQGFLAGLKSYPNIKLISETGNYSRAEAAAVVENLLAKGEKFDAIYAHNDAMASGARIVLKQNNISPASIPTISIDFIPETKQAILNGEQSASFTYPTCGKIGIQAAIDLVQGKKVPKYIKVPSQLITRENVESVATVY